MSEKSCFPLRRATSSIPRRFRSLKGCAGIRDFAFVEKDAFNLVIGQRFSMLNDGDVIFFDLVKYPVLIAIGIIASPLHKIEGFGEGSVAIMAEEATSDKVQIARFSTDRQVPYRSPMSFMQIINLLTTKGTSNPLARRLYLQSNGILANVSCNHLVIGNCQQLS